MSRKDYTPGAVHRVYAAVSAYTEEQAIDLIADKAAQFYGLDVSWIGVRLASAQADIVEATYSLGGPDTVRSSAIFSVEGYGYIERYGHTEEEPE